VLSLKTADQTRKWKMRCLMYKLHIIKMKNFYFKRCWTVHVPSVSLIVSPSTGKYELGNRASGLSVTPPFFTPVWDSLPLACDVCHIYQGTVSEELFLLNRECSFPVLNKARVTRKRRNFC
jgi:hypothetical protein